MYLFSYFQIFDCSNKSSKEVPLDGSPDIRLE